MPDLLDFGPPESGSVIAFINKQINWEKPWFLTVLWLLLTCYLWRRMSMYLQKVISIKLFKQTYFFVSIWKATDKNSRIRIRNLVYGSKDPDPFQNVTDPQNTGGIVSLYWKRNTMYNFGSGSTDTIESCRARNCKSFKAHSNRFPAWQDRSLGSINVYKYGLWNPKHLIY